MPPDRTPRPRQEPVSCDSCRRKKLRCDRRSECSNCRARGLICQYQHRQPSANGPDETDRGQTNDVNEDLRAENAAIRARLQRLEEQVFKTTSGTSTAYDNLAGNSAGSQAVPVSNDHADEAVSLQSRELITIGVFDNSRLVDISDKLSFRLVNLADIAWTSRPEVRIPCQILLPEYEILNQLAQSYMSSLDSLQHVLYPPAVAPLVRRVFDCLEADRSPALNEVALMLGILSNITAHWSWGGGDPLVRLDEALPLTTYWLKCSLDVLEQIRRSSHTTLETVQTHIILLFVLYRMDSFSAKVRYLHANAVTAAKDIGLHLTDAKTSAPDEISPELIVDLEIRRRVWWHLCSTDWCIPLIVSEETTYNIDPDRMRVKKPRNINDDDLISQPADFDRPLSELTQMSYYLHRIRLGEVCRDVSDIFWTWSLDGVDPAAYDRVLAVDRKFDELATGLPQFLQSKAAVDDGALDAVAATQRAFMLLTSQVRRAKLHLPFMLRVSSDPRFRYSRDKCLQLARSVLEMRYLLPTDHASMKVRVRLTGVLHHFFIAIAVLVLDVCVNRGIGDEEMRKEEIRKACTILEDARHQSEPAELFLDSVISTLQKHQIRIQSKDISSGDVDPLGAQSGPSMPTLNDGMEVTDLGAMWEKYFDFDATSMLPDDWSALFNDLTTEFP